MSLGGSVALGRPLRSVLLFGVNESMDAFPLQILVWMVAWVVLAIFGFALNLVRPRSPLVSLCHFVFYGVGIGCVTGSVVQACFGDFQDWIMRGTFVPLRFQDFLATIDEPVYAPAVGMACGVGLALLLWYLRRIRRNAEPGTSPNDGPAEPFGTSRVHNRPPSVS